MPIARRRNDAISQGCPRSFNKDPPTGVLHQKREPLLVKLQPQGPDGPGRIELLSQSIGVLQPREGFG
jgi:hypothetical protein